MDVILNPRSHRSNININCHGFSLSVLVFCVHLMLSSLCVLSHITPSVFILFPSTRIICPHPVESHPYLVNLSDVYQSMCAPLTGTVCCVTLCAFSSACFWTLSDLWSFGLAL